MAADEGFGLTLPGGNMTKFFVALFAPIAIAAGAAIAQSQPQSTPKAETTSAHRTAAKSILISGRVSSDGRRFAIAADNEWDVSNSVALKGHEGSLVTVKCYVDAAHNQIQVVSVNRVQPEVR